MDVAAKTLMSRLRLTALGVVIAVAWLSARAVPSAAPLRVVSLVPAVTEMLYAIGAGPQLIGVSSFDHYPADVEKLPRLGGLIDPDIERILRLKPDLVIVYGAKSELAIQLARANIDAFKYESGGLSNVAATIRALGERLGRRTDAEAEAVRIEKALDAIRARVATEPRVRTLLIFGREAGSLRGIYASGGLGFLHDMLTVAGGDDVLGDVKRENIQIAAEQLLAKAPDAIIELHAAMTPQKMTSERNVWRQLPAVPAVKHDRVYLLANELVTIPGPRVVEGARMMADVLHPATKR